MGFEIFGIQQHWHGIGEFNDNDINESKLVLKKMVQRLQITNI